MFYLPVPTIENNAVKNDNLMGYEANFFIVTANKVGGNVFSCTGVYRAIARPYV